MHLYRLFDRDGQLLYVGISLHAIRRATEHRGAKSWWPLVARMDLEALPVGTRAEAEAIERDVIVAEQPLHNIVHNTRSGGLIVAEPDEWLCVTCERPVQDGSGFVVLRHLATETTVQRCDMRLCAPAGAYRPAMAEMVTKKAEHPCGPAGWPCYLAREDAAHGYFAEIYADGRTDAWYAEHVGKCQPRLATGREFRIDVTDAHLIAAGLPPRARFPGIPWVPIDHYDHPGSSGPPTPPHRHLLPPP